MFLVASSTMDKKYLKPTCVGTEYGPYISTCTRSKVEEHKLLLDGKCNRFYFARTDMTNINTRLEINKKYILQR